MSGVNLFGRLSFFSGPESRRDHKLARTGVRSGMMPLAVTSAAVSVYRPASGRRGGRTARECQTWNPPVSSRPTSIGRPSATSAAGPSRPTGPTCPATGGTGGRPAADTPWSSGSSAPFSPPSRRRRRQDRSGRTDSATTRVADARRHGLAGPARERYGLRW